MPPQAGHRFYYPWEKTMNDLHALTILQSQKSRYVVATMRSPSNDLIALASAGKDLAEEHKIGTPLVQVTPLLHETGLYLISVTKTKL
jgi:hypothetical protein